MQITAQQAQAQQPSQPSVNTDTAQGVEDLSFHHSSFFFHHFFFSPSPSSVSNASNASNASNVANVLNGQQHEQSTAPLSAASALAVSTVPLHNIDEYSFGKKDFKVVPNLRQV